MAENVGVAPAQVGKEKLWTGEYIKILLVSFFIRLTTSMLLTALPLYVLYLGGNKTIGGLMVTFYTLAALVLRPYWGKYVDKKGRRGILLASLVVYTICSFLYGFVASFVVLIIIRIVHGVVFSANTTAIATMATDVMPESRMTEGISLFGLTSTLPVAIAPGLVIFLINAFNYQVMFLVAFCMMLVAGVIALLIRYHKEPWYQQREAERTIARKDLEAHPPDRNPNESKLHRKLVDTFAEGAILPAVCLFFISFCAAAVTTFLPVLAQEKNLEHIGYFFTVFAIVMATSRLLVGSVSKKFTFSQIIGVNVIIYLLAAVSLKWINNLPGFLIAAVFYGMSYGMIMPCFNSMAVLRVPANNRGLANATYYMAMDGGFGIGAVMWGVIADVVGVSWIYPLCIVPVAISLVVFFTKLHPLLMQEFYPGKIKKQSKVS